MTLEKREIELHLFPTTQTVSGASIMSIHRFTVLNFQESYMVYAEYIINPLARRSHQLTVFGENDAN